jgi:hypothetical protein
VIIDLYRAQISLYCIIKFKCQLLLFLLEVCVCVTLPSVVVQQSIACADFHLFMLCAIEYDDTPLSHCLLIVCMCGCEGGEREVGGE